MNIIYSYKETIVKTMVFVFKKTFKKEAYNLDGCITTIGNYITSRSKRRFIRT